MRIAYLVNHFPSLSETFILNQIVGLIKMGHDVEVIAESYNDRIIPHNDVEKYKILEKTCFQTPIPKTHAYRLAKCLFIFIKKFFKSKVL